MSKINLSRNKILSNIADISKVRTFPSIENIKGNEDIYKPILPDVVTCFKNELELISGKCIVCNDEHDVYSQLKLYLEKESIYSPVFCRDKLITNKLNENAISVTDDENLFENMLVGITACEFLVARTGSVLVSSNGFSGRQLNVFPPIHIVIASKNNLLNYPEDALQAIQNKYANNLPSTITTITGPSRTADIEKTLVLGAHGPKEFIVFLSIT